jgi:hypothetical protein
MAGQNNEPMRNCLLLSWRSLYGTFPPIRAPMRNPVLLRAGDCFYVIYILPMRDGGNKSHAKKKSSITQLEPAYMTSFTVDFDPWEMAEINHAPMRNLL